LRPAGTNSRVKILQPDLPSSKKFVQKKRSTGRLFRCSLSGTFPQVLGNYYGSTVNAMQAPLVVTGVLPDAPALKRMTPSSFEQKLRTPDWL
jgi:hypothetical protein